MNYTVTGITVETEGMTKEQLEQAKIFSGKNAGICYMGDSYFDSTVSDPELAAKRFVGTAKTAHHSIADHVRIEVLLENVSKALAIVLNSLQDYATSEKSGRYTIMSGNSKQEQDLYNKWKDIFRAVVLEREPSIDDSTIEKHLAKHGHDDIIIVNGKLANDNMADDDEVHQQVLAEVKAKYTDYPSIKIAQENARYVLSVFTRSTTMGYSTSLRQWNYIYDWCIKYMNQFDSDCQIIKATGEEPSYFQKELYYDFESLTKFIKENFYIPELRDTKNRCFEFLTDLSGEINHPMAKYDSSCDSLGLTYSVSYMASLVHIAQAERHRTLKYFMQFPKTKLDFFVPPMIRNTVYENYWLKDLESVSSFVPQATLVYIIETGHISDFILKCEERLCGRAQWEIMNQTNITRKKFIANYDSLNPVCQAYVDKFKTNDTKCKLLGTCREACRYGANGALKRFL